VQAQIVRLLADIQARRGLAYLLISHDLALVGGLAHRVAVMYCGQIVELGNTDEVFARPAHPYTQALLSATPSDVPGERRARVLLRGEPLAPIDPPETCRLCACCPFAAPVCLGRPAHLQTFAPGRAVRCVRFLDERARGARTWVQA